MAEPEIIDVVIVLGAGLTPSHRATPTLRRRVLHGVDMFERTGARALLLTGGPEGSTVTEAEVMRDIAIEAGVGAAAIVLEPTARDTMENAERSARILSARGWTSAILVTDKLHLPRALLAFRAVGIRTRAASSGIGWRHGPFRTGLHYLAYEAIGIVWYALRIAARKWRR